MSLLCFRRFALFYVWAIILRQRHAVSEGHFFFCIGACGGQNLVRCIRKFLTLTSFISDQALGATSNLPKTTNTSAQINVVQALSIFSVAAGFNDLASQGHQNQGFNQLIYPSSTIVYLDNNTAVIKKLASLKFTFRWLRQSFDVSGCLQ